jgi:hypothetical protein
MGDFEVVTQLYFVCFDIKREFCKNQKDQTMQNKIIALPLSCSSNNCNKIGVIITT